MNCRSKVLGANWCLSKLALTETRPLKECSGSCTTCAIYKREKSKKLLSHEQIWDIIKKAWQDFFKNEYDAGYCRPEMPPIPKERKKKKKKKVNAVSSAQSNISIPSTAASNDIAMLVESQSNICEEVKIVKPSIYEKELKQTSSKLEHNSMQNAINDAWSAIFFDVPLVRLKDDPKTLFLNYGFAFLSASSKSKDFAEKVAISLPMLRKTMQSRQNTGITKICGQTDQLDLSSLSHFGGVDIESWSLIVNESLRRMEFKRPITHQYRLLNALKILETPPSAGKQAIHFDAGEAGNSSTITILLFCSDTVSTMMPRFPKQSCPFPLPSPASQAKNRSFLLSEGFFHNVPCHTGDMLVFTQDTPHFAPLNEALKARIVLFDMLGITYDGTRPTMTDYLQTFEWTYISEIFSNRSPEFLANLVRNQEHDPISHYSEESMQEDVKEDVRQLVKSFDQTLHLDLFGDRKKSAKKARKAHY